MLFMLLVSLLWAPKQVLVFHQLNIIIYFSQLKLNLQNWLYQELIIQFIVYTNFTKLIQPNTFSDFHYYRE